MSSADDHHDQQRRVNQARLQLLAKRQRHPLEVEKALQHFFQIAGALARQQRRRVHNRKAALRLERRRDTFARLHAGRHILKLRAKVQHLLPPSQQVERAQDWQPRLDQRQELLVEDQKGFEIHLLLAPVAAQHAARLDRIDQVAGLREARAQLIGRGGGVVLLLDAAALVGDAYDKLCHWASLRLQFRRRTAGKAKPHLRGDGASPRSSDA